MRSAYPLHLPALMLTVGVTVTWTCAGTAQEYPVKPVRIVAIGPGGTVDFAARLIAQGLAAHLGQQVVVENRPSGVIPGDIVAKSAPDGYTLLVSGGNHWTLPLLQSAPYDAYQGFCADLADQCRAKSAGVTRIAAGQIRSGTDRTRQGKAWGA
jgi:tripartite-type tricarboxylate transporter receptor subunit TctC